jgi:hypothetical protein
MSLRALLAVPVSLSLLACGVKSDLMQPGGAQPDKRQTDPSKPPQPLGQ